MATKTTLEPIVISTLEGLASPGDTISRRGKVDIDDFYVGGHDFELKDGLSYDVALTNTGEGILVTGIVRGDATTDCDRCLEQAQIGIAGEVSCYYLREVPEATDEDEEEYGQIAEDGTIDISEAVQGAVAMDLPYVVLCQPDCKGLCPTCGANLNEGPCGCPDKGAQPDPMSPFAVLASLKFDEEDASEESAEGDD